MIRHDYFYRQRVAENELDEGFDYCEQADRTLVTDAAAHGIYSGLVVAEQAVPNLTVKVTAGVAYDQLGQRCAVDVADNVDCSVDHLNVSTAVAAPGNEKWLSIFVEFDRVLSDPRTDGNSSTVYFLRTESFTLWVKQGAEALIGAAAKPTLESTAILLADVHLVNGQTEVTNSDLDTSRRQDLIRMVSGTYELIGSYKDAIQQLLAYVAAIGDGSDHIPAASVDYAGGGAWADTSTNPATTVELQLDKIISDLASTTAASGGAAKIGIGTSGMAWADGVGVTGGTLRTTIGAIVGALAGNAGAEKIGSIAQAGSPYSLAGGSAKSQLINLLDALNGHVALGSTDKHLVFSGATRFSGTEVIQSVSSAAYSDTAMTVTAANLKQNDVVLVSAHAMVDKSTATAPFLQVAVEGAELPGTALSFAGLASQFQYSVTTRYEVPADGTYVFTVQGKCSANSFSIWSGACLRVEAFRG